MLVKFSSSKNSIRFLWPFFISCRTVGLLAVESQFFGFQKRDSAPMCFNMIFQHEKNLALKLQNMYVSRKAYQNFMYVLNSHHWLSQTALGAHPGFNCEDLGSEH